MAVVEAVPMIEEIETELGNPGSSPEGSLESARVVASSGMNGVVLPAPGRKRRERGFPWWRVWV
jgi:hypothetical protein